MSYNKCNVVGCENVKRRGSAVKFYRFPIKDDQLCEQWILATSNPKLSTFPPEQLKEMTICETHFEEKSFVNESHHRLIRSAIPSVNLRKKQISEMATHVTLRRTGQVLNCQAREIIANVIGFMKDEAELYQAKGEVKIPLINFKQRVLAATGISEKMYKVGTKEAKDVKTGAVNSFLTPSKKPMMKEKVVVTTPNVAHESSKTDNIMKTSKQSMGMNARILKVVKIKPSRNLNESSRTDDVMKTLKQSMGMNARILKVFKMKPSRNTKKHFSCNENVNCYKCKMCGFETLLKILLKKHINLEHKLGRNVHFCNFREFECSRCDFKSSSKLCYLKHRQSCFSKDKKFKCEHCAIEFSSKSGLQEHIKGSHLRTGTETYPQTTEFLSVGEEIDCKLQPRSEDLISMPLSCEFCFFPARDSNHLKYHIERKLCVPEATKWFWCDQCPYMTHLEYSFRVHRRCCI